MSHVQNIMTKNVITVSPETTVEAAVHCLLKHQISGAPVVESKGKLVGIISEYQLLSLIYRDDVTRQTPVGELMTTDVVTIDLSTPLVDVAQAFVSLRVRRLPVVDKGRLVGLVSRRDVLRFAVSEGCEHAELLGVGAEASACS